MSIECCTQGNSAEGMQERGICVQRVTKRKKIGQQNKRGRGCCEKWRSYVRKVNKNSVRRGHSIGFKANDTEYNRIKAAAKRARIAVYGFVKNAALEAAGREYSPRRKGGR